MNGILNQDFLNGLETFINFACSQSRWMDGDKIKWPCNNLKCQNMSFRDVNTARYHVAKYGFVPNYFVWIYQGESTMAMDSDQNEGSESYVCSEEPSNTYHRIIMEAVGADFNMDDMDEPPNPEAQKFYDMLKAADNELWPGCKTHSQLSLVARLMSMKSENHMSDKLFDR